MIQETNFQQIASRPHAPSLSLPISAHPTHLRYMPLMLPPPPPTFADLRLPLLLPPLLFTALIDDASIAAAAAAVPPLEPSPSAPMPATPATPLPWRGGVKGLSSRLEQLMEDVSTTLSTLLVSSGGGGSSTEIYVVAVVLFCFVFFMFSSAENDNNNTREGEKRSARTKKQKRVNFTAVGKISSSCSEEGRGCVAGVLCAYVPDIHAVRRRNACPKLNNSSLRQPVGSRTNDVPASQRQRQHTFTFAHRIKTCLGHCCSFYQCRAHEHPSWGKNITSPTDHDVGHELVGGAPRLLDLVREVLLEDEPQRRHEGVLDYREVLRSHLEKKKSPKTPKTTANRDI